MGPSTSTGGDIPPPPPPAESPAEPAAAAPAPTPLRVTGSPALKDDIAIKSIEVQGNTLVARVMHSGGCKPHTYELLWDGTFQGSAAGGAQAELVLAHDANEDRCEALLNRTASFDLTPLQQRWREQGKGEHGTVELRFAGSQTTTRYAF
ncbi:hypothetical protein [Archangium sp.]|uniref:hypothetical protein n=1 Tax=Archangium sp. TaxID=1872627 RepID=UPI002EDB287D